MPAKIATAPSAWIEPSASPRMSQPKQAAAIASRKITSEENAAGRCPSAKASSPCPPEWLTSASANSAATPTSRRRPHLLFDERPPRRGARRRSRGSRGTACGRSRRRGARAAPRGNRRRRRTRWRCRRGRRRAAPGSTDQVSPISAAAPMRQSARPRNTFALDRLAEEKAGAEHHPDRRERGEEGRVGDRRVHDREMPEGQVAGEEQPGEHDGEARRGVGRRGVRPARLRAATRATAPAAPAPTRQKALVNGPTSAKRTKIGEMPIAIAPPTSARKASGAASSGGGEPGGGSDHRAVREDWQAGAAAPIMPRRFSASRSLFQGRGWSRQEPVDAGAFRAVGFLRGARRRLDGGFVILVDHASNFIPPEYADLGLPAAGARAPHRLRHRRRRRSAACWRSAFARRRSSPASRASSSIPTAARTTRR